MKSENSFSVNRLPEQPFGFTMTPFLAKQPGPSPTKVQPWRLWPSNKLVKPVSGWKVAHPVQNASAQAVTSRKCKLRNLRMFGEIVFMMKLDGQHKLVHGRSLCRAALYRQAAKLMSGSPSSEAVLPNPVASRCV